MAVRGLMHPMLHEAACPSTFKPWAAWTMSAHIVAGRLGRRGTRSLDVCGQLLGGRWSLQHHSGLQGVAECSSFSAGGGQGRPECPGTTDRSASLGAAPPGWPIVIADIYPPDWRSNGEYASGRA